MDKHDTSDAHDDRINWRTVLTSLEIAIEQLITLIDKVDGDADLEDNGDLEEAGDLEPSLGASEHHPQRADHAWYRHPFRDRDGAQTVWSSGACDDREDEHDGREPDVDDELSGDEDEPSLGSFDRLLNQDHGWRQTQGRNWAAHCNSDREAEPRGT